MTSRTNTSGVGSKNGTTATQEQRETMSVTSNGTIKETTIDTSTKTDGTKTGTDEERAATLMDLLQELDDEPQPVVEESAAEDAEGGVIEKAVMCDEAEHEANSPAETGADRRMLLVSIEPDDGTEEAQAAVTKVAAFISNMLAEGVDARPRVLAAAPARMLVIWFCLAATVLWERVVQGLQRHATHPLVRINGTVAPADAQVSGSTSNVAVLDEGDGKVLSALEFQHLVTFLEEEAPVDLAGGEADADGEAADADEDKEDEDAGEDDVVEDDAVEDAEEAASDRDPDADRVTLSTRGTRTKHAAQGDAKGTLMDVVKASLRKHYYVFEGDQASTWNGSYHQLCHEDELKRRIVVEHDVTKPGMLRQIFELLRIMTTTKFGDMNPPGVVPFQDCVIDYRSGKPVTAKHHPRLGLTYVLGVKLDPNATCPLFDRFFHETFPDKNDRLIIEEYLGRCMTHGLIGTDGASFHLPEFLFLRGPGSDGKSTLIEAVTAVLGVSNVVATSLNNLTSTFHLDRLRGKLCATIADADGIFGERTGLLKSLVAGDLLGAERKFKDPYNLRYLGGMWLASNRGVHTSDTSWGLVRRTIVLQTSGLRHVARPDPKNPREKKSDPALLAKLVAEKDGIALRGLQGLERLRKNRAYSLTERHEAARQELIRDNCSVAAWLSIGSKDGHVKVGQGKKSSLAVLFYRYSVWCTTFKHHAVQRGRFEKLLAERLRDFFDVEIEKGAVEVPVWAQEVK